MKPHISASQLDSYTRCPEAYRRRYLEGERLPPGVAAGKGSAVHVAAAANFNQKVESRTDLPKRQIIDAAAAHFESVGQDLLLTNLEASRGKAVVLGEALDDVVDMAHVHALEQAPNYQPVLVEKEFRLDLPGERDLVGVIDLADEARRVVDFKTGGKRKSQADADNSPQLTAYAVAHRALTGRPASEVRLDVITHTKTKVSRQILASDRSPRDFEALARRIDAVSNAIAAGSFPPATPGAWWCSPRFCGFWRTCPYVNAERKERVEE